MNFSRAAARARARVKLSVRNRRGLGSPRGAVKNATPAAAAEAAQPTRGTLPHAEVRKIFFGLMLAAFLAALNQTIIATALADHRALLRRFRESVAGSSPRIC